MKVVFTQQSDKVKNFADIIVLIRDLEPRKKADWNILL